MEPQFIELNSIDNFRVLVNLNCVTDIRERTDNGTTISFDDNDNYIHVKEAYDFIKDELGKRGFI